MLLFTVSFHLMFLIKRVERCALFLHAAGGFRGYAHADIGFSPASQEAIGQAQKVASSCHSRRVWELLASLPVPGNLVMLQTRFAPQHVHSMYRFLERDAATLPALSVLDITGSYGPNWHVLRLTIGPMTALKVLTVRSCSLAKGWLDATCLSNLRQLRIHRCYHPEGEHTLDSVSSLINLRHLEYDEVDMPSMRELPAEICGLTCLQQLVLRHCHTLQGLPEDFGRLVSLWRLSLPHCYMLDELPLSISMLTSLRELDLSACTSLAHLPPSISLLQNLQHLWLRACLGLTQLPDGLSSLSKLRTMDVALCDNLTALPTGLGAMSSLQILNMSRCKT